jgi:polysaccharide biosynthesis protein PelD
MDAVDGTAFERRERAPAWQAWVETAALPAAILFVGALIDRRDPFLLGRPFPWLALAPLLVGLRYGAVAGMACGALQMVALATAWRWGGPFLPGSAPELALGWLLAGLVAGEFRDAWQRRRRQLEASCDHARLRLDGLGRAYHALRASHERLQLAAPGRPATLRAALEALRDELCERLVTEPLGAVAGRILALFSAHAFVRAATLHAVDREGRPGPAIACLGADRGRADDPLVRRAARLGELVSVRTPGEEAEVLAAVPLVDVEGRVHAVAAIRDLPFVALHDETLELLALLGGHVGDAIAQAQALARPADRFFRSVKRARADARRHGVPAWLAVVEVRAACGQPTTQRLAARLAARRRRTDDAVVLQDSPTRAAVAILLGSAGADGLERYRARLERFAREELPTGAAVSIRGWPLDELRASQLQALLAVPLEEGHLATPERGSRRTHDVVAVHHGAGGF